MSRELFFFPILADALQNQDRRTALREAFRRIKGQAQAEGLRAGYEQFSRFVAHTLRCWEKTSSIAPNGDALPTLKSMPWCSMFLERDTQQIGEFVVDRMPYERVVAGLQPGDFRLRTETGWTLWEGNLTGRELIWATARRGMELPMAAQTNDATVAPTMKMALAGGALTIVIYPGLEGGVFEVQVGHRRPEP